MPNDELDPVLQSTGTYDFLEKLGQSMKENRQPVAPTPIARPAVSQMASAAPRPKSIEEQRALMDQMIAPSKIQGGDIQPHINALGKIWAGVKQGTYSELEGLDQVADLVAGVVGLKKDGRDYFKAAMEKVKPTEAEMADKDIGSMVLRGIGMAIPIMAEFVAGTKGAGLTMKATKIPTALNIGSKAVGLAGPAYFGLREGGGAAAKAASEGAPTSDVIGRGLLGAGKGVAMGGALEAGGMLPRLARPAVPAAVFGGTTALEGGTPQEAIAQTIVGAGLGIPGLIRGRGAKPGEEIPKPVQQETLPKAGPVAINPLALDAMRYGLDARGFDPAKTKVMEADDLLYLIKNPNLKPDKVLTDPQTGKILKDPDTGKTYVRMGAERSDTYTDQDAASDAVNAEQQQSKIDQAAQTSTKLDYKPEYAKGAMKLANRVKISNKAQYKGQRLVDQEDFIKVADEVGIPTDKRPGFASFLGSLETPVKGMKVGTKKFVLIEPKSTDQAAIAIKGMEKKARGQATGDLANFIEMSKRLDDLGYPDDIYMTFDPKEAKDIIKAKIPYAEWQKQKGGYEPSESAESKQAKRDVVGDLETGAKGQVKTLSPEALGKSTKYGTAAKGQVGVTKEDTKKLDKESKSFITKHATPEEQAAVEEFNKSVMTKQGGRPPIGEKAMTPAERKARQRAGGEDAYLTDRFVLKDTEGGRTLSKALGKKSLTLSKVTLDDVETAVRDIYTNIVEEHGPKAGADFTGKLRALVRARGEEGAPGFMESVVDSTDMIAEKYGKAATPEAVTPEDAYKKALLEKEAKDATGQPKKDTAGNIIEEPKAPPKAAFKVGGMARQAILDRGWNSSSINRVKDAATADRMTREGPDTLQIDPKGKLVERAVEPPTTKEDVTKLRAAGVPEDVLKSMGYITEAEDTDAFMSRPKKKPILDADDIVAKAMSDYKIDSKYLAELRSAKDEVAPKISVLSKTLDAARKANNQARIAVIKGNLNNLVAEMDAYNQAEIAIKGKAYGGAAKERNMYRLEDSFDTGKAKGSVFSVNYKGGVTYHAIQSAEGGVPNPEALGNKVIGSAWLGDSSRGGKNVKLLKGWEFDGSNPELEDKILNTILEKNMTGDKPREVVRKPGVADDAWGRRRDTSFDNAAKAKMRRAMYIQGRTEEKGPGWSEEYELAKKVGAPKDILEALKRDMAEEAKSHPVEPIPKGFKGMFQSWKKKGAQDAEYARAAMKLNDSIDQTLMDLDNEPQTLGPTSKDMITITDKYGDPTQAQNPTLKRIAQYKEQTDLMSRYSIGQYMKVLDQGTKWLRSNPEKMREFMKHLHKVEEGGKVFRSTDPDILATEKWHRMVMDDIAERFDMKKKGIYVSEYATMNYDMNKIWDFFKKPLMEATDYAALPDSIISKLDPKHFLQMQDIARKFPSWDAMPHETQGFAQLNYLNWGGGFSDWAFLPKDLKEMIPEQKWTSYFQHRTAGDRLKFALNEDYFEVTDAYIKTAIRNGVMNDYFLPKAKALSRTLPFADTKGTVRNFIDTYVSNVAGYGKDSFVDNKWNAFANKINANFGSMKLPLFVPKEIAGQYTELLYRGALGPDTAIRNLTQSIYTIADVGGKNFFKGFVNYLHGRWAKTPEYLKFKESQNLIDEWFEENIKSDPYFKAEGMWKKYKNFSSKVTSLALAPMQFTENINKGLAYFAGLEEAKANGMDFKTAHLVGLQRASSVIPNFEFSEGQWHAWNKMTGSQFQYGTTHTSPFLNSSGMRLFTPFWSFPIKSIQFVKNGIKESYISDDYARLTRFVALSGFMISAPILLSQTLGVDAGNIWGKGMLPISVMPAWYNLMRDGWIAAGGNDSDDFMTKEIAKKRVAQSLEMLLIPNGRWIRKTGALTAVGLAENRGTLQNLEDKYIRWGKTESPLTHTNAFRETVSLIGFPAAEPSEARDWVKETKDVSKSYTYQKSKAVQKIIEFYDKKEYTKANNALNMAVKSGLSINGTDLQMAMGRRQVDAFTAAAKAMPKAIKGPYMQRAVEMRKKYLDQSPGTKSQWVRSREDAEGEE